MPKQTIDVDDLVTPAMIAERFGLNRTTPSIWARRYPDYPSPVISIGERVRLYSWRAIKAWNEQTGATS